MMPSLWLRRVWTYAVFVLSTPLFIEPLRAAGFYGHAAFLPLGVHVTPSVVKWVALQLHGQAGFAAKPATV